MFKVEKNTAGEVGKAVIAALDASRRGIPDPPDFAQVQRDLLRFLGAKSFAEVTKSSACLGVSRDRSTVSITRYRIASGGGFEPEGPDMSHSSVGVEEVGRGVLEALELPEGE